MADYYTKFACVLPLGTAENVTRALELYVEFDAEKSTEGEELGFNASHQPQLAEAGLFLAADGDGSPEHVIAFALRCAEAFGLQGQWGFTWALTCSRLRLDGFGGGAHLLDLGRRETVAWVDTEHWLRTHEPALAA
jgi:hypothetical protein